MDNVVFGSECGLDKIRVPVFHSVTDDLGFGGCIHHSMVSVVVECRAYDVAIAAAEVTGQSCVRLVVYENTATSGPNGGGIIVKWAIKVLPGRHGRGYG